MSSKLSRVLGATAITAAVVFGMSGCFGEGEHQKQDVSYGVGAPVKTLVVHSDTGDIRVTGGGTGVQVTEHQRYEDTQPEATHDTAADGTLTLGYRCPDHNCEISYEVKVPTGTVVRAVTDTGSVELTALSGEVDARTGTGSVEATGLSSAKARLTAETGSVRATFTGEPTSVYTTSLTGNVRVNVPASAAYVVNASAQTGSVRVGVRQEPGAARTIVATTQTGDVTVSGA